jgi:hypothetical protein
MRRDAAFAAVDRRRRGWERRQTTTARALSTAAIQSQQRFSLRKAKHPPTLPAGAILTAQFELAWPGRATCPPKLLAKAKAKFRVSPLRYMLAVSCVRNTFK